MTTGNLLFGTEMEVVAMAQLGSWQDTSVYIRISGGTGSSCCQPETPSNPTEVEAMTTVIVAFDVTVHRTVTDGIVVAAVT